MTAFEREDAQPESVGAHRGKLNFYIATGNPRTLRCGFAPAWPKEMRSANSTKTLQHVTAIATIGHEAALTANRPAARIHANGRRLYTKDAEGRQAIKPLLRGETSLLQEGGSGLKEFGPAGAEDWAVAGVGDDPEAGVWNGLGHLDGEFDGIERIAVALDDESAGLNGGEKRRREV